MWSRADDKSCALDPRTPLAGKVSSFWYCFLSGEVYDEHHLDRAALDVDSSRRGRVCRSCSIWPKGHNRHFVGARWNVFHDKMATCINTATKWACATRRG